MATEATPDAAAFAEPPAPPPPPPTYAPIPKPASGGADDAYPDVDWSSWAVLETNDGRAFKALRAALAPSAVLSAVLADADGSDAVVPLQNVSSDALDAVLRFLERRYRAGPAPPLPRPLKGPVADVLDDWDKAFVYGWLVEDGDERRHARLMAVLMAALYLQIQELLDLTCAAVATMMAGKTAEQLRSFFNLADDFTEEERSLIAAEQEWADE